MLLQKYQYLCQIKNFFFHFRFFLFVPMNKTVSKHALYIIISIFFFWGFVAASNGILIPLFKDKFQLTQFQSQFVDLAFYLAYAVGSFVYYMFSIKKGDPLNRIGYKKGLIFGLLISAFGALLFIPAIILNSYFFLLFALFVIGLGFALQQIVANPFVISFGNKENGSQRLNLAGAINSFGTTIGPVLLSKILYGNINSSNKFNGDISQMILPVLILFGLFVIGALVLAFSHLPEIKNDETIEGGYEIFKYPQLTFGMLAIFVYVGVEVTIQSNLAPLLEMSSIKGIDHTKIGHFISLYWGSLMIGRWTGAVDVFKVSAFFKTILKFLLPGLALVLVYYVNYLNDNPIEDFHYYIPFVAIAIVLITLAGKHPVKILAFTSISGLIMMFIGLFSNGNLALYSFLSGGLFCSVMWPCIFTIAIAGLGKFTNQGSSLLIMMILGGAIIPPIQGALSDFTNPHFSYIITVFCFAYLAWYAYKMRTIKIDETIN